MTSAIASVTSPQASSSSTSALMTKFVASDDLIERVELLQQIEDDHDTAAIADLWQFIAQPFDDDALNIVIDSTMKTLLGQAPEQLYQGLCHPSPQVLTFSSQLAGKLNLPGAIPFLLDIAEQEADTELLRSVLKALGQLGDQALIGFLHDYILSDNPVISATALSALVSIDPSWEGMKHIFDHMKEEQALALLDSLSSMADATVVRFLVANSDHSNQAIRQAVAAHLQELDPSH